MSVFWPRHRSVFGPLSSSHYHDNWTPFYRLFDDTFRELQQISNGAFSDDDVAQLSTWTPKFDVKETDEGYVLTGELPGVKQQDLTVEFMDDTTLAVRGRTETVREQGQRPSNPATIENDSQPTPQIEMSGANQESHPVDNSNTDTANDTTAIQPPTPDSSGAQDQSTEETQLTTQNETTPRSTYWISERSVGQFQRVFTFPSKVNHDTVKASLKDGILSIVVPKIDARAQGPKKVEINLE